MSVAGSRDLTPTIDSTATLRAFQAEESEVGVVRSLLALFGGIVVALVIVASVGATSSAAARSPRDNATALRPVPSLTPAATRRLWSQLVRRPQFGELRSTDCRPLRAVFYAATDWLRLATKLAANASPCAQYYISVPPLVADKTLPRSDQAWRIRALGPAFHALAEVNVTAWTSWVATTGNSWYAAGVEARRRLATAGYDITAGDSWALNELSSAVRQGVGSARVNMRAFLHGLYDGDGALTPARGTVFVAGISQPTGDLSLYQARLQDWYEDAGFWEDISHYVNDWSQELYGDIRNYAVAGRTREARRDSLNEYLQHQMSLANVAPTAAESARTFLAAAYSPLANAAWQYDASFGWTNVSVELMQDYVSAQTYASGSAANSHFGFAWSPRNLAGMPSGDFNAQTDALLVRLAAAIADSAQAAEAACGSSWCNRDLDGANVTTAWQTFATWKPSALAFATPTQSLSPGVPSAPLTVELRTSGGTAYTAGLPVTVELTSSSTTGEFSTTSGGPWTATLTTTIASGETATSVYFRDAQSGSVTIAAAAAGKTAATQTVTIGSAPPPAPPQTSSGGSGPDLLTQASITPTVPTVGATITYLISVNNLGAPASRAFVTVQLPSQVVYTASQTDRGPGCTGTTTLTCDLDFLTRDLVATVRIQAVVRQPGTLTLTATSSAQPSDIAPANDMTTVVTPIQSPEPLPPTPKAPPTLKRVSTTPAVVTRTKETARVSIRFRVSQSARLHVRVTQLRSTRPIALLAGTTLAGSRSTTTRREATATVSRPGAYILRARIPTANLVHGRSYLVRFTAVYTDGQTRTLTIRARA
jgi:uncharacterized repeat protein (TIGR01451 family)